MPTDLARWKQDAIGGLGEPCDDGAAEAKQERRRIKELERDLSRKDVGQDGRLADTVKKARGGLPRRRRRMTRLEDHQILLRHIAEARAGGARLASACALAGIDPRTLQRWRAGHGLSRGDRRPEANRPAPSHALTAAGQARIIAVANELRFAETPPARIVPALADEGTYIASEASFHRVLSAAGQMP